MGQAKFEHGVILFDGVCNLCNHVVQFIIPRDPGGYFKFAALQSAVGERILKKYHLSTVEYSTIIFIYRDKLYTKSTAALLIARTLPALWPVLSLLLIIPKFIRDPVYDWVAKNRYKWFGQKESCMLPTVETKNRFLN